MEEIKSTIDANITPNGEQGITGSVLNRVLNDMVDATEGKLAQLDQEWQSIKDANFNVVLDPHIERVEMTEASAIIEPDKFYVWKEPVAALAVGLNPQTDSRYANAYLFQFTCPEQTATSLSLPLDVVFNELPNIQPGLTYQVSILDNLAIMTKWDITTEE